MKCDQLICGAYVRGDKEDPCADCSSPQLNNLKVHHNAMNITLWIMEKISKISQCETVCSSRGWSVFLFHFLLARKRKPNTPQFQQKRLCKEPVLQVDRSLRLRQIKWLHFNAGMNLGFLLEISEMFSMCCENILYVKLQNLHNIKLAHSFMRYIF